ncbi:PREDICTED: uncharacterized protein LOC104778142 [Camelina sativa]|uniref:Uncharacterized protein LOC104778142 n=1 Tax=Camelina sativa TaxID=90675 RepID=A0ABM0YH63_CAMSA|nr:PREDICTED: uncharacterized protein LOC104778142 [Camelina sativa]
MPLWTSSRITPGLHIPMEEDTGRVVQSYKGAATNDRNKGKGKAVVEDKGTTHTCNSQRSLKGKQDSGIKIRSEGEVGDHSAKPCRFTNYAQFNDHRHLVRAAAAVVSSLGTTRVEEVEQGQIMVPDEQGESQSLTTGIPPLKRVRRPLFHDPDLATQSDQGEGSVPGMVPNTTASGSSIPSYDLTDTRSASLGVSQVVSAEGNVGDPLAVTNASGLSLGHENQIVAEEALVKPVAQLGIQDGTVEVNHQELATDQKDDDGMDASRDDSVLDGIVPDIFVLGEEDAISGDDTTNMCVDDASEPAAVPQVDKVRKAKPSLAFKGNASKKLNVYLRTTPRKRPAPKHSGWRWSKPEKPGTGEGTNRWL